MSSFGSSLINKSGKKVIPKAAGRRRPGAATAGTQDASRPSARSSVESSQTPQPEPIASKTATHPSVADGIQSHDTGSDHSHDFPLVGSHGGPIGNNAHDDISHTLLQLDGTTPTIIATTETLSDPRPNDRRVPSSYVGTASHLRSQSPVLHIPGSSKRRRLDTGSETSDRLTSPLITTKSVPDVDDDEIPVVQVSKRTPPKQRTAAKIGNATASSSKEQASGDADGDGLVPYEIPRAASNGATSGTTNTRQRHRSAVAPLLSASVAGPKPRAKGTRRQQWQVTTQADLTPARESAGSPTLEQADQTGGTENDPIAVVGPKARKVRKDKGIKKGPRTELRSPTNGEASSPPAGEQISDQAAKPASGGSLTTRSTRGRPIAPLPTPPATATSDSTDGTTADTPNTPPAASSTRLRNLQKRKAKQVAIEAARSRAAATETAAAIDNAVNQSLGDRSQLSHSSLNAANPLLRVQAQDASRSRQPSTAASDVTESTVVSEGGTRRKKRNKRQATPEGNETVFIAEKVTPMMSLVGRDTENRVGMRSTTEMRMREFDWKVIREEQKDNMIKTALEKGSRKTNDPNLIFGTKSPVPEDTKPTKDVEGEGGGEASSSDDEDDLDRLIASRRKKYGAAYGGVQITMVNGEHRLDEVALRRAGDAEDIDDQLIAAEELDEDELKKQPFNVHTFIKWKRREPGERIYQSARWTEDETEKFYEALRCCGVDFGSMAPWFPTRIRRSLKRKFNIEERVNPERIDETLRAHTMAIAKGDSVARDDGSSWDMAQFHANGVFQSGDLLDPRQVEEELARIRVEREKEIAAAKLERTEELRNQRLAGVEESEEEESEEVEEDIGDMIDKVRKELIEKKRKEGEAARADGDEEDEEEEAEDDGEEDEAEDELLDTVEDAKDRYDDDDAPEWDE